jgi:ABC-type dipeptide/oligopeptide/nickel transport system ATPase component
VVRAVDGVSYDLKEGETLGLVGESGCGKSVSALSILRLIANPPGKIVGGEIFFEGKDLLKISEKEIRNIRGNHIAMIFQEPMTSLNPVLTIGLQIGEALELHRNMNKKEAREEILRLLRMVGISDPERRIGDYPHQFSGGMRQR